MEFNCSLKIDLKHLAMIILIIATSVLIFTGKLKEFDIKLLLENLS